MLNTLNLIIQTIEANGGKIYFVGGFVRDKLLNIASKDVDIEVFGLSYQQLFEILEQFGKVDLVGKAFGVLKVTIYGQDYDFNLPRKDSKNGIGHKGFSISVDHTMTIEEAASRRDFTINSMSIDSKGNLVDPFNGREDLRNRKLNPTSITFKDDVLRILRAFQFSARFDLFSSYLLNDYCFDMIKDYYTLPKERIWEEWKKWALKGKYYSQSLRVLRHINVITLYPEIDNIVTIKQDPTFHPEGRVIVHTGYVLDAMHDICVIENVDENTRLVLIFSALCHDFGKATCTQTKDNGRITAYGHEAASGPLTESFLTSIGCPRSIIDRTKSLVSQHMSANQVLSNKAIRRLSVRLNSETIRNLALLIEADQSGRPPLAKKCSDKLIYLITQSFKLGILDGQAKPFVVGQDLLNLGYTPGPIFGKLLKKLYEMQISGSITSKEQGLSRVRSLVNCL